LHQELDAGGSNSKQVNAKTTGNVSASKKFTVLKAVDNSLIEHSAHLNSAQ
jgi:hypothetical protein